MHIIITLCVLLLSSSAALAMPSSITVVADNWCPYNCEPDSEKPGYVIELIKAIYEPENIKVNYEIMPWTRAINATRDQKYTAIICAAKNEAPDFVYPQRMVGVSIYKFYTRKDSDWTYQNTASLENVALGAVDGYSYNNDIDAYLKHNRRDRARVQLVSGEFATEQNIRKLMAKRIDVMLEDPNVVANSLLALDEKDSLRASGRLDNPNPEQDNLYLAFSPNNPDAKALAAIFDRGLVRIRETGELERIMNRYGLEDWR